MHRLQHFPLQGARSSRRRSAPQVRDLLVARGVAVDADVRQCRRPRGFVVALWSRRKQVIDTDADTPEPSSYGAACATALIVRCGRRRRRVQSASAPQLIRQGRTIGEVEEYVGSAFAYGLVRPHQPVSNEAGRFENALRSKVPRFDQRLNASQSPFGERPGDEQTHGSTREPLATGAWWQARVGWPHQCRAARRPYRDQSHGSRVRWASGDSERSRP